MTATMRIRRQHAMKYRVGRLLGGLAVAVALVSGDDVHALECGDVNASGFITASDALLVLLKATGGAVPPLVCPIDPGLCELPATGQKITYGFGDDGSLRTGATLAYTDNGDGTISDLNTGLIWEKKVAYNGTPVTCVDSITDSCADPHDADNRYVWTAGTDPYSSAFITTLDGTDEIDLPLAVAPTAAYDGTVVTIFLEQLNNRCSGAKEVVCGEDKDCIVDDEDFGPCGFAGYRDWRLPSRRELESIVDLGRNNPTVNPIFDKDTCVPSCKDVLDPACSCNVSSYYWTSSTYGSGSKYAWDVYFLDGSVGRYLKTGDLHVRAVRGGR